MANTNPLKQIAAFGQSIWCDNIERRMIKNGTFRRMIDEDGLKGVTSNPTIFEKAVTSSSDYDAELRSLGEKGLSPEDIYWKVVIKDIQDTADIFLSVYKETKGEDGFVSIEVNPLLARDTEGTLKQARDLWKRVARPNVMIKIPATAEGLPAIQEAIADGININVTLIFAVARHREVMNAYLAGLEKRFAAGKPVSDIASVASFFVSRVDTEIDKRLEEKIKSAKDDAEKRHLRDLLGKAAIANSKIAYEEFEKVFSSPRFEKLKIKGARVQRPLWASTSTKNPAYRDVVYVEELLGPQTVNTLPPATIDAFRDHGKPASRLTEGREEAARAIHELGVSGIDLDEVTRLLEEAGVKSFSDSFHKLIECIQAKEVKIGVKTK